LLAHSPIACPIAKAWEVGGGRFSEEPIIAIPKAREAGMATAIMRGFHGIG